MRKTSLFTTFSTHPKTVTAAVAGAALGGAALASWLLKPKPQGDQQPNAQPDETGSPSAFAWGRQPEAQPSADPIR